MFALINANSGSLITTFEYCDSIYGYAFQRMIYDNQNRKIILAGNRLALNFSSGTQVFLAEIDFNGNIQNSILINDSSSISAVGSFLKDASTGNLLVAYDTYKYQTAPGCTDFEIIQLDSIYNLLNCKYRPNFIPTRLSLKFAERMSNLSGYRFWGDNFFIETDDSLMLTNSISINYNFPANIFSTTKGMSFNNSIITNGFLKANMQSNYNILFEKFNLTNNACFYNQTPLTWSLQNGTVILAAANLTKSVYSNISAASLPLTINNTNTTDSTFCLISELQEASLINDSPTFYPNPFNDILTIKGLHLNCFELQLMNATCQLVYHKQFTNSEYADEFNISFAPLKLPIGIYFLRIIDKKSNYNFKLCKI